MSHDFNEINPEARAEEFFRLVNEHGGGMPPNYRDYMDATIFIPTPEGGTVRKTLAKVTSEDLTAWADKKERIAEERYNAAMGRIAAVEGHFTAEEGI